MAASLDEAEHEVYAPVWSRRGYAGLSGPDGRQPAAVLYTDGACAGNPGRGGWAYLLRLADGAEVERSGGEPATTNNRMELTAVIEGLRVLPAGTSVRVESDSRYVVDGASQWRHGWARAGWQRKVKGRVEPLKNADLWQALAAEADCRRVTWQWVRGHDGHAENERCDRLANRQAGIAQ